MKQRSRKVRWNHSSFMQRGKREKSSRAPFLEAGERTKLLSMSIRNDQGQLEMYRMTLFLTKEYSHFPQQEQPTGEMEAGNHSSVTEFILLGLTEDPVLGVICFVIFLGIYVVTLVGNVSIILLIKSCPQLHTPMYLFLGHLASVDSGFSTSVTPVMLRGLLRHGVAITTAGCEAQLFSVVFFGTTDGFLLATMAYDRYVAICMPLLYSTHMSPRVCVLLLGASYLGGCVNASLFTSCLLSLSFCGPNQIDHFFCDFTSLLKLTCSEASILQIIVSISSGSIIMVTGFVILLSYIRILFTILKMPLKFTVYLPKWSIAIGKSK